MKSISWILLLCLLNHHLGYTQAAVPAGCDGLMDVVFLLDSSESMIEYDPFGSPYYYWEKIKEFLGKTVSDLPVSSAQTHIALNQYADNPRNVFRFDQHYNVFSAANAISSIRHEGGVTYTSKALRFTQEDTLSDGSAGQRQGVRNEVVILSDGLSNYDTTYLLPNSNQLKTKATIHTIAVNKYVDEGELKSLASDPKSRHYLMIENYDMIDYYALTLVHRLCGLPDPDPPDTPTDTPILCPDHCEACHTQTTCDRCQLGYYWNTGRTRCEECDVITDLVLLVDNSGSIRDKNQPNVDNYAILKNFLVSLVNNLDVGPDATRVAAIRFSEVSRLEFYLNTFSDKHDIQRAIFDMNYDGSHTNTSGALRMAREQIFLPSRGDRPDVRNVVFLITDGESTRDKHLTVPEAQALKDDGTIIFVVGVTNEVKEDELKNISSSPWQTHYFNSTEVSNLESILAGLIQHVCNPDADHRYRRSVQELGAAGGDIGPQSDDEILYAKDLFSGSGAASAVYIHPSLLVLLLMGMTYLVQLVSRNR